MGSSKKPRAQTTTQQMSPWGPVQPYLIQAAERAGELFGRDPEGASRVSPQSPETLQSQQMMRDRIMSGEGSSLTRGATQALGSVLNQDPYRGAQDVFNNIWGQVAPRVQSTFSSAGRTGGGLSQDALTRSATEAFSPFAYNMYQDAIQNRMRAAQLAPQLDQAGYADIGRLGQLGSAIEQRQERETGSPWEQLQRYAGILQGLGGMGGSQASSQPGPSRLQTGLGGALSGAAAGAQFGPMGGLIGGGLGLLGGLF